MKIWQRIFNKLDQYATTNYYTVIYGIARTSLAVGTLVTLLFSSIPTLYAEHLYNRMPDVTGLGNLNLFHLFGYEGLIYSKIIAIVILLSVISGFYPRITGILHWYVSFSFFTSATIIDGGDQITAVLTLFLVPITLLDDRSNHWQDPKTSSRYKNFFFFVMLVLIQIQMAVLYLQAGIEKPYKTQEWLDGTAIYYWLNHQTFGAPSYILNIIGPIIESPFLVSTLTWGSIVFELTLAGAIFMTAKSRARLFPMAIAFHLMILVMHGLVSFFFAMGGALILYLCPKNASVHNMKRYVTQSLGI